MDEEYEIDDHTSDSEEDPICPAPVVDATKRGKTTKLRINTKRKETQKTKPIAKKGHLSRVPDGAIHQSDYSTSFRGDEPPTESQSPPAEVENIQLDKFSPLYEKVKSSRTEKAHHQSDAPSSSRGGERPAASRIEVNEGEKMPIESLSLDTVNENIAPLERILQQEIDNPASPASTQQQIDNPISPNDERMPQLEAQNTEDQPQPDEIQNVVADAQDMPQLDEDLLLTRASLSERAKVYLDEGEIMQMRCFAEDYDMLPDLRRGLDDNNVVMFFVDSLNDDTPPKPKPAVPSPDTKFYGVEGYVDLPWDPNYITEEGIHRGMVIMRELKLAAEEGFTCFSDFETLLIRLRTTRRAPGLDDYFKRHCEDDEREAILILLHEIVKLALRAPELITSPLPILVTTPEAEHRSVTLSQEQCAALLACSFLGLFPYGDKQEDFNEFNVALIMMQRNDISYQKLCFVFNYFANVICHPPSGVITFRRDAYALEKTSFGRSDGSLANTWMCDVAMTRNRIEECPRMLQVDFANKYIGGGVFGQGCVQEEIRFLCCPELMVSMLLCPMMKKNESITIAGAKQYSNYEGYSNKTRFVSDVPESQNQPRDKYKRIMCEVLAIDAFDFHRMPQKDQFEAAAIGREIHKAHAGFKTQATQEDAQIGPVATGNWGCGAFNGHLQLKCIIQWLVASMTGRDILYCTFSQEDEIVRFCDLVKKCRQNGILIFDVHKYLRAYQPWRNDTLFEYIHRRVDQKLERERSEESVV